MKKGVFLWCCGTIGVLSVLLGGCVEVIPLNPDKGPGATENGCFTITVPSNQQRIPSDTGLYIRFTRSARVSGSSVQVALYKGEQQRQIIASTSYISGAINACYWDLSDSMLDTGSDYRIRVASTTDTAQNDFSSYFTISRGYYGTITVVLPYATSIWTIGNNATIDWDYTGKIGSYVSLALYLDSTRISTISTSTSAYSYSNSYSFSTAAGSGSRYRVKVTSLADTTIYAYSAYFTVRSPYYGGFRVIQPAEGAAWNTGSSYAIAWNDSGSTGDYTALMLYRGADSVLTIVSSTYYSTIDWVPPLSLLSDSTYRIKVRSTADVSLAAFSPYIKIIGLVTDQYEPDNQRLSATALQPTVPHEHTLTYNDTDWIKIVADSGDCYAIRVTGGTRLPDVTCYFDTAKTVLKTLETSGYLPCVKSGTYYLKMYYNASYAYGSYTVTATKVATSSLLRILVPGSSSSAWAIGSSYNITWADSGLLGSYMSLKLYKGTDSLRLITSSTGSTNRSFYWSVPSNLTTGSNYRIKLTDYYNPQLFVYSDSFTINGIPPDIYENNNTRATATEITSGIAQSHYLGLNDTDWVKFTADSGNTCYLKTAGGAVPNWRRYSGSDTTYTSWNGATTFVCPKTATYYNRAVYSTDSYQSGSYVLTFVKMDSNPPITFTAPTAASVWAAGSSYAVAWTNNYAIFTTGYVTTTLYDATTGKTYPLATNSVNSGSMTVAIPVGLPSRNTYKIQFAESGNPALVVSSAAFTISGIPPDQYEPDDSVSYASTLTVNSAAQNRTAWFTGTNTVNQDVDWIKFPVVKDSLYSLMIQCNGQYLSCRTFPTLAAASAGTSSKIVQSTDSIRYSFTASATGDFYLKVMAASAGVISSGSYSVRVGSFDRGALAVITSPNAQSTWVAGEPTMCIWNPLDYYGAMVMLSLYRDTVPLDNLIGSTANDGSVTVTLPANLASRSDYRLKIRTSAAPDSNDIYSFSSQFSVNGLAADGYEDDNGRSRAVTINADGTVYNHSLTYRDTDWVSFPVSANTYYTVRTTGIPVNLILSTVGSTTPVASDYGSTTRSASITWFATNSASALLSVQGSSAGAYTLKVTAFDSTQYGLAITAPASAASFSRASMQSIVWANPAGVGGSVDIFLYRGNNQIVTTIKAAIANSGIYQWQIPTSVVNGADYYIRIQSLLNPRVTGQSAVFSITN